MLATRVFQKRLSAVLVILVSDALLPPPPPPAPPGPPPVLATLVEMLTELC